MNDELPSEFPEVRLEGDRAGLAAPPDRQGDRVLPTAQRGVDRQLHAVEMGHEKRIYVDVVGMYAVRVVLNRPFLRLAQFHRLPDLARIGLSADPETRSECYGSRFQFAIVETRQSRSGARQGVVPGPFMVDRAARDADRKLDRYGVRQDAVQVEKMGERAQRRTRRIRFQKRVNFPMRTGGTGTSGAPIFSPARSRSWRALNPAMPGPHKAEPGSGRTPGSIRTSPSRRFSRVPNSIRESI